MYIYLRKHLQYFFHMTFKKALNACLSLLIFLSLPFLSPFPKYMALKIIEEKIT